MSENHLDMLEESVSKPGFLRSFAVLMLAGLLCFGSAPVFAQAPESGATTDQEEQAGGDVNKAPIETPSAPGAIPDSEEAIAAGSALFRNNCQQCHAIREVVVGPALQNVHQRRDVEWLKSFIRNSQRMIQSGDPYAVKVYNEFNKTQMPAFNFNDEQLLSVLAYIKAESNVAPGSDGGVASPDTEGKGLEGAGGEAATPGYITAILVVLGIVLILVLIVLGLVLAVLRRYLTQRTDLDPEDKEILDRRISLKGVVSSKPFLFLLIFIFTAVVFKSVIDGLYSIGVQQGYMPTQPIAFSHKLHAGTYQIGCNYCHTGAFKAKSANIPSVNICMNCHNTIQTESPEIRKLYAAQDNNAPIEWVRIHNLPDLAYFNHAQHTSVGGLECQTCHGPIQEMDVVYQYSKLTMGWCINCHRETEVRTEGNEYYDKLVKLHEVSTAKGNMTVEDIGGLECSRCHY